VLGGASFRVDAWHKPQPMLDLPGVFLAKWRWFGFGDTVSVWDSEIFGITKEVA
jgi:hypothetical protein